MKSINTSFGTNLGLGNSGVNSVLSRNLAHGPKIEGKKLDKIYIDPILY